MASGDGAEQLLPYGIAGQLMACADAVGVPPGLLASDLSDVVDPIAVGGELVTWFGELCAGHGMALVIIDDLQWADGPSARALLFAVRRLRAVRVLIATSPRTAELVRLGPGWPRFLARDHRVARVRLGALRRQRWRSMARLWGRAS